ncbi:MoaD/ThiS family protein [Streptomyces sp. DH37]|uniref:MoaD/ThiS family protein n=1 Tax=Streptomyces sp. DH37 TaxID=3040122 RepID=UPI00244260B9|nr:MoaD/ThiS family protein [Streptomyces sp. DH37]MDG9704168.1 MoaD/ThiS family protein [Streptomyces sp. DH37]
MTTTVRIPTILRQYTGGAGEVRVAPAGPTVADALRALEADHPGVLARVCDERGALRRFVNLYVGEDDVRMAEGMGTKVPDGALISIIPAVAGG